MRFLLTLVRGNFSLSAPVLVLAAGPGAHAQQAGDTTSVHCGLSLARMLCVDLDGQNVKYIWDFRDFRAARHSTFFAGRALIPCG
ncbi:hypothetical protein [Hymenobacter terricola]|uniref:hypothetical protein n=1 Tax=Hymenobacter terricola TaxID=2819236 RepID=UPI001B303584|nr:hypothetical protein [Hymenobacter terricola]